MDKVTAKPLAWDCSEREIETHSTEEGGYDMGWGLGQGQGHRAWLAKTDCVETGMASEDASYQLGTKSTNRGHRRTGWPAAVSSCCV